jgi:hypothetical protein
MLAARKREIHRACTRTRGTACTTPVSTHANVTPWLGLSHRQSRQRPHGRRTRRARNERWYLVLSLPPAIVGFVFTVVSVIVGLGMAFSFAGMLVGLPLLTLSSVGARQLGAVNRRLAGSPPGLRVARRRPWVRSRAS